MSMMRALKMSISVGITAGSIVYGLTRGTRRSGRRLKARAGKALRYMMRGF